MCFFSFELIVLRASYTYRMAKDFLFLLQFPKSNDQLKGANATSAKLQNLNFLIFHPILIQIFCQMIIFMSY